MHRCRIMPIDPDRDSEIRGNIPVGTRRLLEKEHLDQLVASGRQFVQNLADHLFFFGSRDLLDGVGLHFGLRRILILGIARDEAIALDLVVEAVMRCDLNDPLRQGLRIAHVFQVGKQLYAYILKDVCCFIPG